MTSNTNLYGQQQRQKPSQPETPAPSSSSLAFTTQLSSLISQHPSNTRAARGRTRPSRTAKSDIFSTHNRGAQKRAAADLQDDDNAGGEQVHQRQGDIGGAVDEATLHRSKRRMEEKARMYEDLKRGAYLEGGSDSDDDVGPARAAAGDEYLARLRRKEREGLVDFDRKWAAAEEGQEQSQEEEGEEKEGNDDNASIISYEDELGRTRHGTRAEAAAAQSQAQTQEDPSSERWRPARPDNLIHGATVQSQAFNPDANITTQMSYLASRRDRSPTPPEATHYDPDGEVRNRGTGFYAFSRDEGVRKQQMEELMGVRDETIREREAKRERRAERERLRDERRRKIEALRVKRRAEVFLANLEDLGV